jgi:2-desacetyl-2-hydroxyethyl bacteriochlorophyllide A dehydrogenase
MRALVLRAPQDLAVMEVPKQEPTPGQVLVRVSRCGVCGSDLRYFNGENPWAKQTLGREVPNPPNIILGHEFVGVVEEAGDPQDAYLIGKRVGVNTFITCGRCAFCRSGRENLCAETRHLGHGQGWGTMDFYPGGMAEWCPAFANQVYDLPDHVTDDQATFLDPMIASLHAVDVGAPKPLDQVAVLGAGPIGLLIAQFVKVYGASRTYISDIVASNLAAADAVGVDMTYNAAGNGSGFRESVLRDTGGAGVDLVFNTVGSQASIEDSLGMLKKGGTCVLLATQDKEIRFPALLLSGERTIKTSSNALYSDFPRALELLATGTLKVEPLITHRIPLSRGCEAFELGSNKTVSGAIKIILDCKS